ncbi:MAG: cation:proton antiporter [Kiritimatiellia bacterium]|nr:cation:proton antiporter [Kiritimatiellia bacterium]
MHLLMFQVAAILLFARLLARIAEKYLKLPGVMGELAAGILIGPFFLGAIPLPGIGPLFPALPVGESPISPELLGIATLGSLVLLFFSGLETDLRMFLRYSKVGILVGLGGVVISFAAGAACGPLLGLCDSFMHPTALFLGAVATATSVGITARILSERGKTSSPEGVTIFASAVLDDVLGLVVLAIVVALQAAFFSGDSVRWSGLITLGLKVLLVWILFTAVGIAAGRRLARLLRFLGSLESIAVFCLGLALLVAGLIESAGLAMILGAFILGLSLSRTDLAQVVRHHLRGAYDVLTPIFFCVMGMMIDFSAMKGFVVAGLIYSAVCILSKLIGCCLPAYATQFNLRGALRIGWGMVPRGEVALVIAAIGLNSGAVSKSGFGVAVLMTIITTLLAPPLLTRSFRGGSGIRKGSATGVQEEIIRMEFPEPDLADLMIERLARAFQSEGFFVHLSERRPKTFQVRQDNMVFTLRVSGQAIELVADRPHIHIARFILLEEILLLKNLAESMTRMADPRVLGNRLVKRMFDESETNKDTPRGDV